MFPDQVSQAVLSHYDKLPPSAKPGTRSNGVGEWTVLAGVVAVVNSAIYPLTIATGVKAMPDEIRKYSLGKIVHDMHAEILALRLFNLFLLEECYKLEQGNSKFVEKFGDKFKLRDEIRLVLYISEPPCGDASLAYSAKGEEGWNEEPEKKRQKVLRGRSFYGRVGAVRTKPGRSDSLITLSKSCSDKLCAKQELGLTNALTAPLFPHNCYLDSIVVRDGLKSDFDRCFGRIETSHPIELQFCSQTFKNGKPAAEDLQLKKWSPSPLSAMKIVPSGTFQVLNNGVKNGSYVKGKPPKRGGESIVCNWSMAQRAKQLYKRSPLLGLTYHAYKTSLELRQRLKQKVRNQLQTWTPTLADDFTL
jgi:tRNA-specific adenosine deaminase 1